MRRRTLVAGVLVVFLVAGFLARGRLRGAWENFRKPDLPSATFIDPKTGESFPLGEQNGQPVTNATLLPPPRRELPSELNIAVPFTSQAPHANWDEEHGEFCEEAAVLMAGRYFTQRSIASKDDAEAALQQLKARELALFGYFKDTTAEETARLIEDRYPVETELLKDPTVERLKAELARGHLVIVPAAGRQLKNPNFRQPGPLYHMLVLKGYTKDGQFITNDPGTRKGADYVYPFERIMAAMHDWNGGDVTNGEKVVILVRSR